MAYADKRDGKPVVLRITQQQLFQQMAAAEKWRREMHEKLTAEGYEFDGVDCYTKEAP